MVLDVYTPGNENIPDLFSRINAIIKAWMFCLQCL